VGWVTTTGGNGERACESGVTQGTLSTPIVYTGRVITLQDGGWSMPDLSDYAPGVPAFEECNSIGIGGYPVALTPARQIVLPTLTLPFTQTSASLTSTSEGPSESTSTRPPTTSVTATLPSRTPSPQQSDAIPATIVEPTPSQGTTRTAPAIVTPTRPSTSSDQGAVTDELPNGPQSSGSSVFPIPPASQDEADETINPVAIPADSSSPPSPDAPRTSSIPPSKGVPESSAGNSDGRPVVEYVEPSSAPNPSLAAISPAIIISRVRPIETPNLPNSVPVGVVAAGDQPADPFASYIAAGISGNSVDVDGSDLISYILGNGATLAFSEPAVVVSGTTFSALPSGSGVVAVAAGTSTTLTALSPAGSTPPFRVPVAPNENGRYVLQDGSTITAGGQAVSVSGTTYSAVSSDSGIVVIANGQSTTLDAAVLPILPPQNSLGAYILEGSVAISAGGPAETISGTAYSALPSNSGVVVVADGQSTTLDAVSLPTLSPQDSPDAYILGGSVTVSAGGSAQTISGTAYSALPSNSGLLVMAAGGTTTISVTSIGGSDPANAVNSYILDGTATISAGGSVVAISGTTYSALPSGSGVVAIEGGKSSTIGENGNLVSNATGGTGQQDDVMPFMGGAAGSRARPNGIVCRVIAATAVVVLLAYSV
jgi:hypothetical protein